MSDGSRHGLHALVTGAARRVGRAIALELARAGFDLTLTYHTSKEDVELTAEECRRRAGDRAITCDVCSLDLNDLPSVVKFGHSLAGDGAIDLLVHNASSYSRSDFGSISAEDCLLHYRVNAVAPLLLTQALTPALHRSALEGGAAVIAITDAQVLGRPHLHYTAYALAKAATNQLVHNLASELAPNVRAIGIAPGVVAWPDTVPHSERDVIEERIPLRRAGTPEDVARLVRSIALDAPYITGEIIRLDGGASIVNPSDDERGVRYRSDIPPP